MVTRGFQIPSDKIVGSLPMWIRANYTYPNGVRPVVKIQMVFNETEKLDVGSV
jgi:hypothetical protein